MENVIIRTRTGESTEKEVIRKDKEDVDMEKMYPLPQLTYLPGKKKQGNLPQKNCLPEKKG